MSTLQPTQDEQRTMEERMAHFGAKIDQLIVDAEKAKKSLYSKEQDALHRSEAAFDEIKAGLDKAWHEMNLAWREIRHGGERAVSKLRTEKKSCCSKTSDTTGFSYPRTECFEEDTE